MANLLAQRYGAQDRIIPEAFRHQFRANGFRLSPAPEGLPLVDLPTILDELEASKPVPELDPETFVCGDCGKQYKTQKGLRGHRTKKH